MRTEDRGSESDLFHAEHREETGDTAGGAPGATAVTGEPRIRAALRRGDFSRWRQPGGYRLQEKLTGDPGRLFLIRHGARWYAGYKTLSDYVFDHPVPGIFCSRVYWHNIVGLLEGFRVSDTDVRVSFHPLDEEARRAAFDAITATTPIVHPFLPHDEDGTERTAPANTWLADEERAAGLDAAEEHIRRYTRDLFGPSVAGLTEDIVAFDPACSTGRFLADFATLAPERIRTVGQDLSREMTEHAAGRLETVHHGDAMEPCLGPGSVDVLFCRFLNSEVVSTRRAREVLDRLVALLRPGASMALLGHSPVLLDVPDLEAAGLQVLQTTARQDDYVFQYYLCRKPA